jgi:hypothetical protein
MSARATAPVSPILLSAASHGKNEHTGGRPIRLRTTQMQLFQRRVHAQRAGKRHRTCITELVCCEQPLRNAGKPEGEAESTYRHSKASSACDSRARRRPAQPHTRHPTHPLHLDMLTPIVEGEPQCVQPIERWRSAVFARSASASARQPRTPMPFTACARAPHTNQHQRMNAAVLSRTRASEQDDAVRLTTRTKQRNRVDIRVPAKPPCNLLCTIITDRAICASNSGVDRG